MKVNPLLREQMEALGLDPDAITGPMRDLLAQISASYDGARRSLAVLKATQEAAIDGIVVTCQDGRVPAMNRRFRDLWGVPGEAGTAKELLRHMAGQVDDPAALAEAMEPSRTASADDIRLELALRDGRVLDCYSTPVRSPDGQGDVEGRVWFFRDVTAERVAQATMRDWTAELERRVLDRTRALESAQVKLAMTGRLASLGQLAAGIAHEINNPLAYMNGNLAFALEELQRAEGPSVELDELVEAIRRAREGADRIHHITRDLKIFSAGESDRRAPLDLRRVIESAVNLAFNEIRHRARLVKDYGDTPIVTANESRLGQVFLNLLLNAAQAIPEGAADQHKIKIVTRSEEGHAVVEISDTGPGIAPEHLPRLFEPFFTTKPAGVGTGLGLSICHGVVTSLGGVIEVDSTPGRGATFRVRIPANVMRTSDALSPVRVDTGGPPGRVLVIDDEPLVLSTVKRALAREHQVVTTQDAREALSLILSGQRFDLILCDLMMPTMTGMEFHAALTEKAPEALQRLVFLTGGAFTPRAREFLDEAHTPFLEKPFDLQELRSVARRYVGHEETALTEAPRDRTPTPQA